MQKGYNMRIKINNFAKIKKADIEINGITVIAGENNTGKSTVGKALYSVFDSFYNISTKTSNEKINRVYKIFNDIGYFDDSDGDFYYIDLDEKIDEIYEKISEIDIFSIPKSTALDIYSSILSDYINDKTIKALSTRFNDLLNNLYVIMGISDENIRQTIVNRVFSDEFNKQFLPLFTIEGSATITLTLKDEIIDLDFSEIPFIKKYIPVIYPIVYIDNPFLLETLNENGFTKYRGKKGHSLSCARKLNNRGKFSVIDETLSKEKIIKINKFINEIIHGNFIEEDKEVKFKEDGIETPIHISNLSTGIKSFATILRLLNNNYILENSSIILDEPEVNLHPQWQLKYAELLVFMQKELNLHILLNTHSPYFINAIEVYSSKYETASNCKYYLSTLDNCRAVFEDVTSNIEKIYEKLASPFQTLTDIEETLDEDIEF